jgi:2-(1,2-epoxy-1,2-dihydrophenyl)acetyl-CoA isomerase
MSWEHVRLDVEDGVATITLNRPEALNAFIGSMRRDLLEAIQEAARGSRALVITGAGRAFSSGGDVSFMTSAGADDIRALVRQGKEVVTSLTTLAIPTLASVNGVAAGAGLSLALACDVRILSATARLGATFSRVGLHPDWGCSYFLTRLAGPSAARELVFTGRLVDADEALRLGLVNEVVEAGALERRTREVAESLRDAPPLSLRWARKAIALAEHASLPEVLDLEEEAQLACFESEDAREGLRAFSEKRPAKFHGR